MRRDICGALTWGGVLASAASILVAGITDACRACQQPEGSGTQRNSTRKQRVEPDEVAALAGSGIHWMDSVESALQQAQADGRPVLWYVPTVPGTFTDRKPVIDRYMLAGPLSWPAIVNLVNRRFHPVRVAPDEAAAARFGLRPYEFVEPGFLVLSAEGNVLHRLDRMTTFHPQWVYSVLAGLVSEERGWSESAGEPGRAALDEVWQRAVGNDMQSGMPDGWEAPAGLAVEAGLLRGMIRFRQGDHGAAREIWREISRMDPAHPLAAKAAMEAQGIGPFVRGFEVFGPLPEKAWRAGLDSAGSAAPAGTYDESAIWNRATRYLLGMQSSEGGFHDSDYDFGGYDSMPNVHCAVTALAGMALLESRARVLDADLVRRLDTALERIARYCADDSRINAADSDEILWAESYRLRFLVAAARRAGDGRHQGDIQRIAGRLENLQLPNGTWYHEYPNAFVTATALTALADAALAGATVDRKRIDSGLRRLASQRFPSGAYPYSQRREGQNEPPDAVPASAGRTPVCELARFRWNAVSSEELARAVETGMRHHEALARALKYDNHTSTYAFGGFFFWYDMQARSEAIAGIEDVSTRHRLAAQQRELILGLPELDGCFVDSHELGRCYGTAMALQSLALMEQALAGERP